MRDDVEITRRSILGGATTAAVSALLGGSAQGANREPLQSEDRELPIQLAPEHACD